MRTLEQRIRAFVAKIRKVPLLHSLKFARLRMIDDFIPNLKALVRIEAFTETKGEQYTMPLFARKLYFLFTKWLFKHFADHYPKWSEMYIMILKEKLVRKIAYNFWLDKIPPFHKYTLTELYLKDYNEICTLIDESKQFTAPIKPIIEEAITFVKPLACHLMGNVPLGYTRFKYYHAYRITPEEVTRHTRRLVKLGVIGYRISKVEPELGLRVIVVKMS